MRFNIFSKHKKSSASKSLSYQEIAALSGGSFLNFALTASTNLSATQAMEFYKTCSAVATAVDMIADEIENLDIIIENIQTGDIITDNPILELLRKPNPAMDSRRFISQLAHDWLLTRNAYFTMVGNPKFLPSELWRVNPRSISTQADGVDNYPLNYLVTNGPTMGAFKRELQGKDWRYFANEFLEIEHVMGFSSGVDETRADSPLLAAALEVQQQVKGRLHNAKLLDNGGRLSLVAVFRDTMDGDQHNKRSASIRAQLGGASNAGAIAVISSEDLELKEMGTTNKDMDYSTLDKISSEAIFLRYKIPLPLISADASTYNNFSQAKFDLYDRAVIPTFRALASSLSKALFPRAGLDTNVFRLTFDMEKIPSLRGRMLEELRERRDLNLESTNELRGLMRGRPDVPGGDTIYQPATLVPIGGESMSADFQAGLEEQAADDGG